MNNSALLSGIALAGIGVAAGTSLAAVSGTITDQATVEAGLASFVVEDFDDEAVGDLPFNVANPFNGFSVTANGTSTFSNDLAINGSGQLALFVDSGNIASFTFNFDAPIDTFAAEIGSPVSAGGFSISFDNGDFIDINSIAGINIGLSSYVSLVTDTPFSSFTIEPVVTLEGFTFDNVVSGVQIPSPGAAGLLGLAGLAAARRRRGA